MSATALCYGRGLSVCTWTCGHALVIKDVLKNNTKAITPHGLRQAANQASCEYLQPLFETVCVLTFVLSSPHGLTLWFLP